MPWRTPRPRRASVETRQRHSKVALVFVCRTPAAGPCALCFGDGRDDGFESGLCLSPWALGLNGYAVCHPRGLCRGDGSRWDRGHGGAGAGSEGLGLYTARALSYAGVEVEMLEHPLSSEQIRIYDAYASAFEIIHNNLNAALEASNITGEGGKS